MQLYCTRPGCSKPTNFFDDLDNLTTLKTVKQKFCTNCGMPLVLADRYLPTKLLGQGGFGAAFLARDRYTPGLRQCVVKQFQPSGRLTSNQLKMAQDLFEREAEALEQLGREHSQIPDLFAFFELSIPSPHQATEDKFFYLVQEFIDGETLEERLIRQGRFSESDVLDVLKETLKILQFVHENGSIHRDIKPSNIMWNLNGRLYLLDFGAVKYATKAAGGSKASTSIYSLGFAPPEQVSGDEVYPSTDLYALAVTCIMLLTGKQPPELFNAYNNSWKWQSYVQTSQPLADVLDKMLLPVPDQRFQAATDVLEALVVRPQRPQPPSQPTPLPTPNTSLPAVVSTSQPIRQRASVQPFSILELLGAAAFTGCEGALLAIALFSLPIPSPINAGLWLALSIGLVVAQSRRIIEKVDLVILAGITFAVIGLLPALHAVVAGLALGNGFLGVAAVAVFGGLSAIAVTALFRLIYKLLTRFF